jgi:hypothetical protein
MMTLHLLMAKVTTTATTAKTGNYIEEKGR